MASTAKIILAVTGIFVAGVVTGGIVGIRFANERGRPQTPDRFGPEQMKRLADKLELTPEQHGKILPLINQTTEEMRKARRESFQAAAALLEKLDAQVTQVLTEPQRKRLAEMRAEENEKRKQWMAERAKRQDGRSEGRQDGRPQDGGRQPDGREGRPGEPHPPGSPGVGPKGAPAAGPDMPPPPPPEAGGSVPTPTPTPAAK